MELQVLWSGLISFIHMLSEIANELIAADMLMSDLKSAFEYVYRKCAI